MLMFIVRLIFLGTQPFFPYLIEPLADPGDIGQHAAGQPAQDLHDHLGREDLEGKGVGESREGALSWHTTYMHV